MSTEIRRFEIVLHDNQSDFYAGNFVQGRVILDAADSLLLKNFSISLEGSISCRFGRKGKREHLGDDNIYHFTPSHRSGFARICDEEVLLVKELDDSMVEHVVVESGEKSYPFSFSLHPRFPGTFQDKFGHVFYQLKANIESTGGELNLKLEQPITLIGIVDSNRPIYMEGFSGNAYKEFGISWIIYSAIEITASVDRVCYLPGDTIYIDARADNYTNRRVKGLKAKLLQKIRYHSKKKTYIVEKVVAKITSEEIPKGKRLVWKQEPFKVPECHANLYVELIEIKYELRIQCNSVFAAIPIVIGTIPHKSKKLYHQNSVESQLGDASRPNGKISESLRIITNDVKRPLLIREEDVVDCDSNFNSNN